MISFTKTWNVFVTLSCVALTAGGLLSVTFTKIVFVLGPSDSSGVQEMAPLDELIVIPLGGLTNAKVKVLVGMSGSVAEADTLNAVNSLIV